ncbi:MAG: DUF3800 domain-containing protein [Planctomycetota bacterium]|nr:MAG: DUF3800 domain-containing protein [Planctomycetota bacterium]
MYLLYLDDAGSVRNKEEEYLVLGGVCVSEQQVHWMTEKLDELSATISPERPEEVEFHASEIFSRRRSVWRRMDKKEEAQGVIIAVLKVLVEAFESARAFACAVRKADYADVDPMAVAFEEMCNRFDLFLGRKRREGDRQRGLLIMDKSAYEATFQRQSYEFRTKGTRWGKPKNLIETPLFVDSRVSRLVQLADHVAYAVFRRYNAKDAKYFDVISSRFDQDERGIHGLVHKVKEYHKCMCPACLSRRMGQRAEQA